MSGRTEVIVIGGGQAGMAAGYYLARNGIPFLILDAAAQPGESWRQRWDSLELFTPARYSALPGLPFPSDAARFPGKDEVADYMAAYARAMSLPIHHGAQVTSLSRVAGGYRLETGTGSYEAAQVIVATGAYQRPHIPPIAAKLSGEVTQLHSAAYRNPAQIPGQDVLVVGTGNSGAQIAADLAPTHRVYLSQGTKIPRLPRRILGASLHWWGDHLGLIAAPFDTWRGRTQRGDLLVGTSLRQLAHRHGVNLVGRAIDAGGRAVHLAGGQELPVDAVVWATGYRPDYSWIHVPILGQDGSPRHARGVTASPGLYFLGMHNQYSRGSSLIYWVRHDAAYIASHTTARPTASGSGGSHGGHAGGDGVTAYSLTSRQADLAGMEPDRAEGLWVS